MAAIKKSLVRNGGGGVSDFFFMLSVSFQVGLFIAALKEIIHPFRHIHLVSGDETVEWRRPVGGTRVVFQLHIRPTGYFIIKCMLWKASIGQLWNNCGLVNKIGFLPQRT